MSDRPPPPAKGELSPDRQRYWDGREWAPALSQDGQFRWDGKQWVSLGAAGSRVPTGATRTLQLVTAAWLVVGTALSAIVLFAFRDDTVRRTEEQLRKASFTGDVHQAAVTSFTVGVVVLGVFSVFYLLLALGAMLRWTWAHWAAMIVLGLVGLLGLLSIGSFFTSPSPPLVSTLVSLLEAVISLAVAIWLLVTLIRVGPWAQRQLA